MARKIFREMIIRPIQPYKNPKNILIQNMNSMNLCIIIISGIMKASLVMTPF